MPRTPDNIGGPLIETEYVQFYDEYNYIPTEPGTLVYHDGYFYARDAYGAFNLRKSGVGLSEEEHETLDTLVHDIDETSYEEYTYSGPDITNVTIWTSVAKVKKIREEQYTYGVGHRVLQVVTTQYDSAGNTKMTMTENYTYTVNNRASTVARVKT